VKLWDKAGKIQTSFYLVKEYTAMSKWKDEDIATVEFIEEYLKEFKQGILNHPDLSLDANEKTKVLHSLNATEKFCKGLLTGKKGKLYMHDLILMAIGFYGGHLTALEAHPINPKPANSN
jgi:hypothetical protein